jgi:hypothetical protein
MLFFIVLSIICFLVFAKINDISLIFCRERDEKYSEISTCGGKKMSKGHHRIKKRYPQDGGQPTGTCPNN